MLMPFTTSMKRIVTTTAFSLLTLVAAALPQPGMADTGSLQASRFGFPLTKLQVGMHVIEAEVAATQAARMQGLMYRQDMGTGQGMAFVFDGNSQQCMWMRNTLLPLSVAFLDANGRIINIEDMTPQTEDNHCSSKPAKYALEMNQGWFAKRGVRAGDVIKGLTDLKAQ